jgi:hypothetical protein
MYRKHAAAVTPFCSNEKPKPLPAAQVHPNARKKKAAPPKPGTEEEAALHREQAEAALRREYMEGAPWRVRLLLNVCLFGLDQQASQHECCRQVQMNMT